MILGATITGSLILNGVNLASITGSEASINALNSFTASAATTGSNVFKSNQTVTGSVDITGSLTVVGPITGTVTTASYVLNAVSASYALVATSASYALVATSASYSNNSDLLDGRDSLTFTNTGSNSFVGTQNINGSVAITGSLTTTGAITAQTLNVQQVTSSIVYSSGSNIFGNSVSNTQSMTGSVGISGSLSVNGVSTLSGALSGTTLSLIGTNNVGIKLKQGAQIQDTPLSSNFYNGLVFENTSTTNAWGIGYSQGAAFSINYFDGASTYSRYISITTGGNVGIGTTTPGAQLEVMSTTGGTLRLKRDDGSVTTDESLGTLEFYTNDGDGAHIGAYVRGLGADLSGQNYGRFGALSFGVSKTANTDAVEAMRIDLGGALLIGGTTNNNGNISINSTNPNISFGTSSTGADNALIGTAGGANYHITGVAIGDFCIRPIATGNLLFGTSASAGNAASIRLSITPAGAATFSALATGAVYSTSGTLTNTAPSITATGGTIVTSGGFKYHTFTSSGTFQVTAGSGLVEVFVLGGGGAGGGEASGASFYGGGGGAGGGLYNPAYYVEVASYTVTVGAGGTPNAVTAGFGGDGSNSVFGNITALGGGGGARGNVDSSSSYLGRDGGCGGGGGSSNSVAGITTQSITNGVAYGNGGANGNGAAGGGGGIGTQPTPNTFGGYGKYVMNQANRIGGGGGGGTFADGGVNAYDGGGRGGRNGSAGGTAGTANTGGGGGGLGYATGNGGAGGSGIVIVKYKA